MIEGKVVGTIEREEKMILLLETILLELKDINHGLKIISNKMISVS